MLRARWPAGGRAVATHYQVLTVRDDRVVAIQDCRSRREAKRLLEA